MKYKKLSYLCPRNEKKTYQHIIISAYPVLQFRVGDYFPLLQRNLIVSVLRVPYFCK